MQPIGQILNFVRKREFQGIGVEHSALVHVKDAPKIDKNSDQEVISYVSSF